MQFTVTCTIDLRLLAATLAALLGFGIWYDRWVASLEAKGYERGYLSLVVTLGVFVTIAGLALSIWSLWLPVLALLCFVASGLPMICGSIKRYVVSRETESQHLRGELLHILGNPSSER